MKIALTIFFLFSCIVLQLGLREVGYYISLANLVLVYLCLMLANNKTEYVLWCALAVGILLDVLSGAPDGVMAISIPSGVKLAEYIGNSFFTERLRSFLLPAYAVFGTIGAVITGLLVLGVMSLLGWVHPPDGVYYLTWLLPICIFLNLLILAPVYGLYNAEQLIQKRFLPKS